MSPNHYQTHNTASIMWKQLWSGKTIHFSSERQQSQVTYRLYEKNLKKARWQFAMGLKWAKVCGMCIFLYVAHFPPYLTSPLADRRISYAKQAPYFRPRDLCLDLSMCLMDMWGQHADHAGETGALLICQSTRCGEKYNQYLVHAIWLIYFHAQSLLQYFGQSLPP